MRFRFTEICEMPGLFKRRRADITLSDKTTIHAVHWLTQTIWSRKVPISIAKMIFIMSLRHFLILFPLTSQHPSCHCNLHKLQNAEWTDDLDRAQKFQFFLHVSNVCNNEFLHNSLQLVWCWLISSQTKGIPVRAFCLMSVPLHNIYRYECYVMIGK